MFSTLLALALTSLSPVSLDYGDTITINAPAAVVCPPPVTCQVVPPVLSAVDKDDSNISISVSSIPSGTASLKLTSISTVGRETGDKVGPNPTIPLNQSYPLVVAGFHPGWKVDLQILALDANGKTLASSNVVTIQTTGDGSVTWPATTTTTTTGGGTTVVKSQGTVYNAQSMGIQNAINASKSGDTIYFPKGAYSVTSTITIPSGRMLLGETGAQINGNSVSGANFAFYINSANITVANLILNNAEVKIDSAPANLLFDNDVFQNYAGSAVEIRSQIVNSKFTNNLWQNASNFGYAIYCDGGFNGLTLSNNVLQNVYAGWHIDNGSANLLMEQNYMTNVGPGPGAEFQGGPNGVVIQDNVFEKPHLVTTSQSCSVQPNNCYDYAYSIPLNNSSNVEVRRNKMVNTVPAMDGLGSRIVFELGGKSTIVEDNYIYGGNQVFGDTDGTTSNGSVIVRNNHVEKANAIDEFAFPGGGRSYSSTNNNASVTNTWNVNRANPQRNIRY